MKSHLFKFIPFAAAAALAFAVSPLQAAPRGGHGGGGGHAHMGGGGRGHMGGGGRGFVSHGGGFRGGHVRGFAHVGPGFHHGPGFRGRAFIGSPGPFFYGSAFGYPYYDYGYPYSGYPYVDTDSDGDTSTGYSSTTAVDNTSTAVQEALANAGYYHGAIDGIIGPGSAAAISGYQRDHGLPVTGMIDANLIRSLGMN